MKAFKQLKFCKDIERRYKFEHTIGQGSSGTVRLCRQVGTGKQFAVKIMRKQAILQAAIYVELLMNEL